MKKLLPLILLLIISGCSSDDDTKFNGFEYESDRFGLMYAWISDQVNTPALQNAELNFTNKYFTETGDVGRNTVRLRLDTGVIEKGTFPVILAQVAADVVMQGSAVVSQHIIIDGRSSDPDFTGGTVNIRSINANHINLEFTLTRNNGSIIRGSFQGVYTRSQF
jgi:hypothetical protein